MSKANIEILTLDATGLDDFKKDKTFNEPWADRGIYLTLSPFKAAAPSTWSVNVTSSANLTTIRPAGLALPKFDNGLIVLVRREDKPFTEYETDWVTKQLHDVLRKTDLDFVCPNPASNPITYDNEKQDELSSALPAILEELKDYRYVITERYFKVEDLNPGEAHSDEARLESFAGFLDVTVSYDESSSRVRFSAKNLNDEAETVVSTSAVISVK